jgi:rhodanese-related sulfurtransferase
MVQRQSYKTMVAGLVGQVEQVFPWDLLDEQEGDEKPLLLDIRCPHEFDAAHVPGSVNVPRGILEIAADFGYEETVPELVEARERWIVVICRSRNRSILAAHTLKLMGYTNAASLRTGVRGWNDFKQALVNKAGDSLHLDTADELLTSRASPEQIGLHAAKVA